jgi:DNA-binding transcriptional LysR family regulator
VKRLLEEDIEFFVAETRDLPANPLLRIDRLRRENGGFYVRRGHPLAALRTVTLQQVWEHGVASVRVPNGVRDVLAKLLGHAGNGLLKLALECDDVEVLKAVALGCDSVLAAPHAAVAKEVASSALKPLVIVDLPVMGSEMGIVTLRGRTPSPMAELILSRLPAEERT